MKNLVSLKNMVKTVAIFVGMSMGFGLSSCQKDDLADHSNKEEGKAKLTITDEPKPTPVYRDSSWVKVSHDTITIIVEHFRNDTLINADSVKCNFGASIKRTEDKLQTTEARLANLDFSFGETANSRNGKMQFVGKQQITDADGQTYNGEALSGYCTLGSLKDVHAELVSFKKINLKNTDLEPGKDEAKLVNTNIAWNYVVNIVNAPNLAGKEFEMTTNNTEHERYILKNAPELISTDTTMVRRPDVWFTNWDLIIKESWSNDSIAEKKKTVRTNASVEPITLEDKFVSSFDYSYTNNDLSWGAWKAIQSNDSSVSLEEQEGFKLGNASNGYSADAFDTKYVAKRQRATVLFGGFKWNIPAEEVTLSTTRKVFVEQTSDLDGYSMVKFTNDEIARYNGTNDKTLTESCKLYLKLQTPDLDKIEFVGTKVHTEGMAKIDGSVTPVFTDGTKGGAISFKWEKAEEWYWKKDSVIAEGVTFVNQNTGTLTLKGEEKKTAKTFATDNENITIKCNQYDADFQTTVNVDGQTKVTTWHATWYEDFKVVYSGKEASLAKSSYSVKNANDKLTKDEARSTATTEVWGYSVDGIFNIDEDSRSAMGYGRITKALEEVVINEYWDKFSFETEAKEYVDRVEYFLRWIKEYSTGKKTSTDVKIVLKRNAEGSNYTITVEDPERVIGSQSESSSLLARSESASDILISYDWLTSKFELPNVFDGSKTEKDIATFVDPTNVKVTKKNSKGEDVEISLPSFEHELTSTVSDLQKVSESDELVEYTYTRTWNWASTQCTSTAKSIGNINKIPEYGGGEPDFDIEVGKIFATVSRPSNRNGVNGDITAYTYLLVSKDGTKCLPIGIYHDVVTAGEITDMESGFNSACYEKNENKVVATRCELVDGIIQYYRHATGDDAVDAGMFMKWQAAGFNNRGNTFENWEHKYAPHATKKGNVTVVTFEGTNVSYTFRGWNVQ